MQLQFGNAFVRQFEKAFLTMALKLFAPVAQGQRMWSQVGSTLPCSLAPFLPSCLSAQLLQLSIKSCVEAPLQ